MPALRVSDRELVRVRMALRVAVEELAEERAAGTLDLRDEDERLANRHRVFDPCTSEQLIFLAFGKGSPGPNPVGAPAIRQTRTHDGQSTAACFGGCAPVSAATPDEWRDQHVRNAEPA